MNINALLPSVALVAALLAGHAASAVDQYSIFPLPLPAGVTLGANDYLVPAAIGDTGGAVLYSLRNRVTGTVAWYRYWTYYDETESLGTTVAGFQHLELTSINDGDQVAGRAWNTDATGAITAEMPVRAPQGSPVATFGSLSGLFACIASNGDCYGQVFPGAPNFKTLAGARAGYWIPESFTTPGYPLNGTTLQNLPATVQHLAQRTTIDLVNGGAYSNGDYIAGTYLAANGTDGFWRQLRPVGSAWVLDLVVPPAAVGAAYLAGPSVPTAATGLTVTGKATYRAGRDDDSALPTLSFYSDGAVSTLIPPPAGASRNVVRSGGVADVQGGIVAVGMAKHRTGTPTSGTDSDAVAWIWSPGDAQASLLQSRIPRPATPRLGANANAISVGDQWLGGQIVCDGWNPLTTTTTPADQRVLLLTPIPTVNLSVDRTVIAENATDTAALISVIPSATAESMLWPLDIAIVLGGTAVKDVDYRVQDAGVIVGQTSTGVVVRRGLGQDTTGFEIVPIDHGVSGANKTITIGVDLTGAGFLPTNAYLAGATPATTITIIEHAAAPTITAQPADTAVTVGKPATFTVTATGDATLSYTWSKDGTPIPGATTATYSTPATTIDDNYATFSVAVTNVYGGVTSRLASLTVLPVANGTGLAAAYFANQTLAGAPTVMRTDAKVDFSWGAGSPDPAIPADHFSARWTGQVQARLGGTYTFTTTSDDGVRLWVDGNKLIDNWTNHGATANSGQISLQPGATYALTMEYYENTGGATARLAWSGPGFASETVPTAQLYPLLPSGNGYGLAGQYFANQTLAGTRTLARTDAAVDFAWGTGSPDPSIPADHFSVRWSGQVTARTTALHTFTTTSDDGVRLWVDGKLLVDNWTNHGVTTNSGQILLQAGMSYALTMEYYESTGGATARLSWSAPGLPVEVVPASQLTPLPSALAIAPAPAPGRIFTTVMTPR